MPTIFNPKKHLMQLKGKDYLEAKWRLVWLNEECRNYTIFTEVQPRIEGTKGVTVKATVTLFDASLAPTRTATAYKSSSGFAGGDLEKSETGAIGRALAFLGYGTQFAQELEGDDMESPNDSPVPSKTASTESGLSLTKEQVVAELNQKPTAERKVLLQARLKELTTS